MRSVVAGAAAAAVLGLVTGMVSWRWLQMRHPKVSDDQHVLAVNDSNGIESLSVSGTFNESSELNILDVTGTFNESSKGNISRTFSSVDESSDFSSVNSSASIPPIGVSCENSTDLTSGFTDGIIALNSSLLQETNNTEVSFGSDDQFRNTSLSTNSTDDDIDYVKMGQDLLTEAMTILDTGIWDFERRTEDGDAIFSRQLDNGNMVYRLTGIVDMPPQDLLVIIWDGLADYPKWNPSLLECRVLEKINDQTDISYTVSAPGARGYVASRDFVSLRHWDLRHNTYIAASKSIPFPGAPSNPDYIRGMNGPGCMELRPLSSDPTKTEFRWLLNTKLNGWIPTYIADKAYKKFMTKYMIFLREYCKKIKQRVTPSTTPRNITE